MRPNIIYCYSTQESRDRVVHIAPLMQVGSEVDIHIRKANRRKRLAYRQYCLLCRLCVNTN